MESVTQFSSVSGLPRDACNQRSSNTSNTSITKSEANRFFICLIITNNCNVAICDYVGTNAIIVVRDL